MFAWPQRFLHIFASAERKRGQHNRFGVLASQSSDNVIFTSPQIRHHKPAATILVDPDTWHSLRFLHLGHITYPLTVTRVPHSPVSVN